MDKIVLSANRGAVEINGRDFVVKNIPVSDLMSGGFMTAERYAVLTKPPLSAEFLDEAIQIIKRYIEGISTDDLLTLDLSQFTKLLLFTMSESRDIGKFFDETDNIFSADEETVKPSKNALAATPVKKP
jgi:hypothetical protein